MLNAMERAPKVLIAEDDPATLRVITIALTSEGMEILAARDGLEAYEKALLERPDAIVLDIGLPSMDGLTVCRKLKSTPATADIPVGFLTAQVGNESYQAALKSGGLLYLPKPFNPQKLAGFVRLLLSARKVA